MNQRELIVLLERQLETANSTISELRYLVDSLRGEIESLKEALFAKGKSLETQKNVNKGLKSILKNESEKQKPDTPQKRAEEIEAEKQRKKEERKAKGNYGAKRNPHYECKEEIVHIYPDTQGVEADRIREVGTKIVTRYGCRPIEIAKNIYIVHGQKVDGKMLKLPIHRGAFFNSNYESSFVAAMLELHYCHRMYNSLYHKDHEHRIGKEGWTQEDHRKYRQDYAPPILDNVESEINRIIDDPAIPPDYDLRKAIVYARNEMKYVREIFNHGFTRLDNNLVEIISRYISMRRRSSMFFGSHKGAERYTALLSLACSCRQLGINFRQYITDSLDAASQLPPTAPYDGGNSCPTDILPNHKQNESWIPVIRGSFILYL